MAETILQVPIDWVEIPVDPDEEMRTAGRLQDFDAAIMSSRIFPPGIVDAQMLFSRAIDRFGCAALGRDSTHSKSSMSDDSSESFVRRRVGRSCAKSLDTTSWPGVEVARRCEIDLDKSYLLGARLVRQWIAIGSWPGVEVEVVDNTHSA